LLENFSFNFEQLKSDLKQIIDTNCQKKDGPVRREIPQLFYIDEKKKIFKFYDFESKNIVSKFFTGNKAIPMFSGIGYIS
jgi:hypothetical protein